MKKVLTIALSLMLAMSLMISASAYMTDKRIYTNHGASGIAVRFYLYVYQAEREMGDLVDEIEAETSVSTLVNGGDGFVVETRVKAWLVAYNPDFNKETTEKISSTNTCLLTGPLWTFNAHNGYSKHFASTMSRVTGYQETGFVQLSHDFVNY